MHLGDSFNVYTPRKWQCLDCVLLFANRLGLETFVVPLRLTCLEENCVEYISIVETHSDLQKLGCVPIEVLEIIADLD